MTQAISDKSRKAYNNEPLRDGESLVPMLCDRETAKDYGADPANIRTWTTAGIQYQVMFIPVPEEQAEIAWQTFWAEVNDLLNKKIGPNRYARCRIPLEDGRTGICPKDGRKCTGCAYKGQFEREDRTPLSIDQMTEYEYHLLPGTPSPEDEAMEMLLLDELFVTLEQMKPLFGEIVRLGMQGLKKKEIIECLPIKKSQAYQLISECEKAARDHLRDTGGRTP